MPMKSASASKASQQLNNELIPDSESQTVRTHAWVERESVCHFVIDVASVTLFSVYIALLRQCRK